MEGYIPVVICILLNVTCGFLLDNRVRLQQQVSLLPQFTHFGKSMVLVGCNLWDNNTEIYNNIVHLAGGRGVARIGIINAASDDAESSFKYYHDLFIKYGVLEANRIPIDLNHTADDADQSTIDLIYNQTGFFFGGGDQARVIKSFLGQYGEFTPALIALHQMFDSGAVISGTSAGTTCQTAHYMIQSGKSYEAFEYGSFPDQLPLNIDPDALVYGSAGGLGFMKGYVLDSHFSNRGREGRMMRMLMDTRAISKGTDYGIGIDENTALVVTHADTSASRAEVLGVGGVSVFDFSKAHSQSYGDDFYDSHFHFDNAFLTYLTKGDSILLTNHAVDFSWQKSPMLGHERNKDVIDDVRDVFGGSGNSSDVSPFVKAATSCFDSKGDRDTSATTLETIPVEYVVHMNTDFYNGQHVAAVGWVERRQPLDYDLISYKNVRLIVSIPG